MKLRKWWDHAVLLTPVFCGVSFGRTAWHVGSWARIRPVPPAGEGQILNHWAPLVPGKSLSCLCSILWWWWLLFRDLWLFPGLPADHLSPFLACVCLGELSRAPLFATPGTAAHQAPLSMEFSRQEYWSGLPFPSPGDLPSPGIKSVSLRSPALSGGFFTTRATWETTGSCWDWIK